MLRDAGEYFNMTAPKADRGFVQPWAPHHAPLRTRRDLDSLSTCPALERGKFTQSLLDVLAIATGVLLACATGVGFAFAIYVCLFVRIP